ncbi:hypothetical protein PRIPAC_93499 [Pristionchus pacificus]|uniref:Cyp-14A1 n=1 Tax=Pristionchus pacificus TaxID=54126 RepID=A0A2A6BQJ5_PRIPA|nr:hypothetical protein PRIPAC_93499 [Pristionchus pacificus]|eukprot:PDM68106.1 cyp-14A1 [Pristionchus pacificus]
MIVLLLFIGALTYVFLYYQHVRKYPRGPLPLPLIGNLYHINPEGMHEYLHMIGKEYGHCFTLFMPRPVVFFTEFSLIKEALVTQGEHFAGRSHLPPEEFLQKVDQTGITVCDGEVWREQRRAAVRILREHGMGKNIMEAKINLSIDELLKQLKETNDGVTPFDMYMPIQLCVGNIINETLFGYHFKYSNTAKFEFLTNCLRQHLKCLKDNVWVLVLQAWPWTKHLPIIGRKGYHDPIKNISNYHNFIEEEVNKIAEIYNVNQEPTNFVQSYVRDMKKNPQLDMVNLYAIVVDFWFAGMETTSTALRWCLLYLMKYPHVQDKVRAELLSVVGSSQDRRLEMADRPNLPYFAAVIAEIQRASNMVGFLGFHRCTSDTIVGSNLIPANTLTLPQVFSVLKEDRIFERPTEFMPERFLEADGKTPNKNELDRLIIFGMGKRQCAGEALARMQLFLVLGTLLRHYRFSPCDPIDLTPVFSTILGPKPYKCIASSVV